MKITWSWKSDKRRLRRILFWGLVAIVLSMPTGLGVAWIKTGINPYRVYYYEYFGKHLYSKPLEDALRQPGTAQISELLQKQPKLIYARFDSANTPLHLAVGREDSKDILALLLKNGAEVNSRNIVNGTPLHRAAIFYDPAAERFLLSNGV